MIKIIILYMKMTAQIPSLINSCSFGSLFVGLKPYVNWSSCVRFCLDGATERCAGSRTVIVLSAGWIPVCVSRVPPTSSHSLTWHWPVEYTAELQRRFFKEFRHLIGHTKCTKKKTPVLEELNKLYNRRFFGAPGCRFLSNNAIFVNSDQGLQDI